MTTTSEPGLGSGNESESSPPSCPEGAAPCTSKNDAGWRRIIRNFTPSIHLGKTNLASLTAALLLPIVPCVVAAASGGVVANVLPDPSHVHTTLIASYMSWGIGVFFSVLILAMYQVRLSNHALPPREAIVSVLLPVGPFGQGGFGIAKLIQVTRKLLLHGGGTAMAARGYDTTYAEPLGLLIEGLGACIALIMWGIGLVWLAYAVISIATTRSFPFNMGWWGFTFPLGVWVACTTELGSVLHSTFFSVTAMIGSGCVFLLWLVVAACTTKQAISGEIFFAPCLKDLSGAERLGKKS
ncbi:uncharacterized protein PG986_005344 [Apiospora aurea]|uniref:Uncharacterized protein n=1 Tax=Apiospora aurea TaxID=335848 RepID=A0ABR1QHA2_9PEZI